MASTHGIRIPAFLAERLTGHTHSRLVDTTLASFSDWIGRNDTIFFRDYTDHGIKHLEDILETSSNLITKAAADRFTGEDAATLICSVVLHDCALHLQEQSFIALITDAKDWRNASEFEDERWSVLWSRYISEASRLNQTQLIELFGVQAPVDPPKIHEPDSWTPSQHLLIGEFLRRHHARIAHEIALSGIPGANGRSPLDDMRPDDPLHAFVRLSGLVARSHGLHLRSMFDPLEANYHLRVYRNCHPIYIMVLLRVADYLQLQSNRAPGGLLRVKRLRTPRSRREWQAHEAISDILYDQNEDPEVVEVRVEPKRTAISTFLTLQQWLRDAQAELDSSWAVLGEVYGRYPEKDLGITIRRIRSNIENTSEFGKRAGFVPDRIQFTAANAELLKLLIKPLYGDYPEISVRELVQNAGGRLQGAALCRQT